MAQGHHCLTYHHANAVRMLCCFTNHHATAMVMYCCAIYRLGIIDDRPSYHSQTQLWPVGYQATCQDAAAGTFQCDILDGGGEGPLFAVSLVPPQAEQAAHVSCSSTRIQCCDTQCCKATSGVQVLWGILHEKHRRAGVNGIL